MLKGYRKVHSVSSKCNALTASYAIICKVACCRSHENRIRSASNAVFSISFPIIFPFYSIDLK